MRDAVFVRSQERFVPLFQILRFRKQSLELGIDDLCNLRSEGLREPIKCFAESKKLNVKRRVGCINCMSGGQALNGKRVFVWELSQ